MTIVAHAYQFVIGVDTHARNHALSILTSPTGAVIDEGQFPTTEAGMNRAIAWVGRRTGGDLATLWVIECAGSYGAKLLTATTAAGYQAVEAARMDARANRGVGKSDALDARRIAAAVLPLELDRLRQPRKDEGLRAALRVLASSRDQMTTDRTAAINALTALLRSFALGLDARRALTGAQVAEVAKWRRRAEDIALTTARAEAVRLAKRIIDLDKEIAENTTTTRHLIEQSPAKELLAKVGVGPVTAAVVMAAWSHEGRLRDEAAFASLAGVNPIPASSGNTVRHRLNRGGDRRLNQALHMAVTRMTHHPETRTYVERRRAEGRTTREIRRILKRYLARQLFRLLNASANAGTETQLVLGAP